MATAAAAQLRLTGAPAYIDAAGRAHPLAAERRTQLLVFLALAPGWVPRSDVAALLWPELDARQAGANLRKTLFRLAALPWGSVVEQEAAALRVTLAHDAAGGDGAHAPGYDSALAPGDDGALAPDGDGAALLFGFDDDGNAAWTDWLRAARQRHQAAWRQALLVRLERSAGSAAAADGALAPAEAIVLAERLLAADPYDEAAMQALLAALVRGGEPGRARARWREFTQRLADELGVLPVPGLREWAGAASPTAAAAGPGTAAAASAGRADAPVPGAAGAPGTSATSGASGTRFIGRQAELRHLQTLLAEPDCRLVTLLGPGGVGKTRFAQQALGALAAAFGDGAIWLALEDLHGPDAAVALASGLARESGVTPGGSMPVLAQVITAWREQSLLLVLDNFEQLVAVRAPESIRLGRATETPSGGGPDHGSGPGGPIVEALLAGCPRLKIVVTSRIRLGIAAEWLLPLAGLPCPEPEDAAELEQFDAVQLFVQAARRVQPALVVPAEAAAIVAICRLTDGLPLALELAAAWTRTLPCSAIAAELQHGVALLAARDAAHPRRHASIELVFEQSWQLLSAEEQRALARLSVFRGGFDAAALRPVIALALPLVAALADRSLLRRDGERITMHPLVHQLAAQRLPPCAERRAVEQAHSRHYLARLAQWRDDAEAGKRETLAALDAELENVRAAWQWAAAAAAAAEAGGAGGEPAPASAQADARELHEALAAGVTTLLQFCDHRGRFAELLAWVQATPAPPGSVLAARLGATEAHAEYRLDRYAAAEARASAVLDGWPSPRGPAGGLDASGPPARPALPGSTLDDDARLQCLKVLGACCLRLGRSEEARRWCRAALEMTSPERSPGIRAALLGNLGLIEKSLGDHEAARALALEALAEQRRLGDSAGQALTLNNLAALHLDRYEHADARRYLEPALLLCDRHGLVATRGMVLCNLTGVALFGGDHVAAAAYAERAMAHAQAAGNRYLESFLRLQRMRLALARSDLDEARRELMQAVVLAIPLGRPVLLVEGVTCCAELLLAQGRAHEASRLFAFSAAQPGLAPAEVERLNARVAALASGEPVAPLDIEVSALARRIAAGDFSLPDADGR